MSVNNVETAVNKTSDRSEQPLKPTEPVVNLLSVAAREVVKFWISKDAFLDETGRPRELSAVSADNYEFVDLVKRVSANIAPVMVMNELVRKGLADLNEEGALVMRPCAYDRTVPYINPEVDVDEAAAQANLSGRRYTRN